MSDRVVHSFDTAYGTYQIVDMIYDNRPSRVLFSGDRQAAQSGIAFDDKLELLFDYNERFMELARGLDPQRILIIGGGMFTLPIALQAQLPNVAIDVVEINADLEPVANQYFGFEPSPRTWLFFEDGVQYLAKNEAVYDLIYIDAYTHAAAEPSLTDNDAVQHMRRSLSKHGVVAANVIAAYHGHRSQALQQLVANYQNQFRNVTVFPASHNLSLWLPQNMVLTAHNDLSLDVEQYLRFGPLGKATPFDLRRDIGF